MNEWLIAATVLIVAMIPCLAVCVVGEAADALAAFEVASTVLTTVLVVLSEGFHRQPFVDLAIVMAFVSIVGALTFARLMERDL